MLPADSLGPLGLERRVRDHPGPRKTKVIASSFCIAWHLPKSKSNTSFFLENITVVSSFHGDYRAGSLPSSRMVWGQEQHQDTLYSSGLSSCSSSLPSQCSPVSWESSAQDPHSYSESLSGHNLVSQNHSHHFKCLIFSMGSTLQHGIFFPLIGAVGRPGLAGNLR